MVRLNENSPFNLNQNSDLVLSRRVAQTLADLQVPILRTLEVTSADGVVTLRGRVRNYYERQLAHAHVKRVACVRQIVDEISVADRAAGIPLAGRVSAISPRFTTLVQRISA